MGMGFAPTWLGQVSHPPASQNHFNHWMSGVETHYTITLSCLPSVKESHPAH